MKNSKERYLTTFVGSFMRPESIQEYNRKIAAHEPYDEAAYNATLKSEVTRVVKDLAGTGLDVVSDGELGKPGWLYIVNRLTGFELRDAPRPKVGYRGWDAEGRFRDFYAATPQAGSSAATVRQAVCVGPVSYTDEGKRQMQRDVDNFKAALKDVNVEEGFLPVVAPCSITTNYKNEYYKSDEEFLFAVADALHEEYKIITDAGLIVQTDDAILANLHDPIVDAGIDYRSWVDMNLRALNHALEGIPPEQVRYHLCWGSWPGPHTTDVPLAEIVDLILKVNCQGYSIEGANPRHEWEWMVWQDTNLPEGKLLLPGVISHAISHVEHPELVAQRIKQYADLIGPENVIASSDCGFAQVAGIQRQNEEIVWAKLESLAEGARLATQRR
jgi:5-methyltetrahydropteroyltriglutamate--homocysteine methyltransferase